MFLRWEITEVRENNPYIQLADIHFYNNLEEISVSNVSCVFGSEQPVYPGTGETIDKIIDSDPSTKFCAQWAKYYTSSAGYCYITFEVNDVNVTSYNYVTANDAPARDPKSWKLYSSVDGVYWKLIDKIDSANITTDRNTSTQSFNPNPKGAISNLSAWTRIGHWNRFNNDYLDGANYVIFNLAEHSDPYKRLYFPMQSFGTYEYHLKISVRTPSGGRIQNENDLPKIYIVSNEPNYNWRPISYYGIQSEYEIPIEESTEFVTYDIPIHGNRTSDNEDYVVIEFSPFINNFDMVYYFQDISFERYTNWIVEDGELVNKSQIEPIGTSISSVIPNLLMRCDDYMEEGYPYNKMYIDLVPVVPINPEETFDPIKFLSRIRVRSTPHGLNKTFPVTKMTIPLDDPGGATYNLGSKTTQSMTNHSAEINSQLLKQISDIPAPSSILQAAKDNASALIKETSNGYVTLMRNAEGLITEILICDRMNYLDPEAKIWRWNINGLGYSSTGYNGEFGLAMTIDGAIVANKITTGTMLADRIRGGNLIMGGFNNVAGTIIVNDENSNPICIFNKAGGTINGKLYTRSVIERMQIDDQEKNVAFWMNLAEGHLYGGSSIDGSDSQIADINLRSQYDVDGHMEFGLGLNSNIIGLNAKQVWIGNTTIGYMVALPQYETDIVTDVSVTKDGDGKVTDINLTKKHLHFIHGMLTQVDDI